MEFVVSIFFVLNVMALLWLLLSCLMGWLCYICLIHVYHIGSVTVEVFVPGEFDMQDHSG